MIVVTDDRTHGKVAKSIRLTLFAHLWVSWKAVAVYMATAARFSPVSKTLEVLARTSHTSSAKVATSV